MQRPLKTLFALLAYLAVVCSPQAGVAAPEKRLALVIGNSFYKAKALTTPINDAALMAQTLQAAGFDVTGARDIDGPLLRRTFRDFTGRVTNAGPDAVAVVYFAGYGLQIEGENYLVPIGADITEASDVPARALGLSEVLHALAALPLKATFIILDAARPSLFALQGQAGLAWVEPEANMLIAYNAAPGTVAPNVAGGYGPYARALAEMIREGNLTPANLFDRVRLRVHESTKGGQVPWHASKIETQFKFLERTPGAPLRGDTPQRTDKMRTQPMRALGVQDAYMVALLRDTFDAYTDFLADYWQDPMTKRVRALLAARREAITWRRTYRANVPDAYWSYLERYPHGPHVADAGRLLTHLGAAIAPPAKFARMDYDIPPPLPDELEYIERPMLMLDDPSYAFEPTQPTPVYFLEPSPAEFLDLKPPAAPPGARSLPTQTLLQLPAYVRLPADVVASNPPINDARVGINTTTDTIQKLDGQVAAIPILQPRDSEIGAGSARLAPKAVAKIAVVSPPPAIGQVTGQVTTEEIKPLSSSPKAFSMPQWFADITAPAQRVFATDGEAVIPGPTMFVAPSSGLATLGTGNYSIPSSPTTARALLPSPRAAALTRPRSALPSPQTTGNVPPSIPPRSVTPAPLTRNPSKPIANATLTSSPTRVDQAKQPKTPALSRPAPSTHEAHTPADVPAPPKP